MNQRANINSRKDGVTKDMQPEGEVVQKYDFPSLGVTVEAKSMDEALLLAKELVKTNKK